MDNENINRDKMAWAQKVVDDLNNSTDKYVVYRTSRPITDIKHMLTTSVELYGDNVAFMQRFEKNEPFKSITYNEAFDTVNSLGTALVNRGLKGKRIAAKIAINGLPVIWQLYAAPGSWYLWTRNWEQVS